MNQRNTFGKKRNRAIALVLAALTVVVLSGAISESNLEPGLRQQTIVLESVSVPGTSTVSTTLGAYGMAVRASLASITNVTWTSSIAALPYAARLDVRGYDMRSDSTVACSSVIISGIDALGVARVETLTSINEAESLTEYAYESVSRVVAVCSGGSTGDALAIRTSDHIALPRKVHYNTDVVAVCDGTGSSSMTCGKGSAYTIRRKSNSIDLNAGNAVGNVTVNANDVVTIKVRSTIY